MSKDSNADELKVQTQAVPLRTADGNAYVLEDQPGNVNHPHPPPHHRPGKPYSCWTPSFVVLAALVTVVILSFLFLVIGIYIGRANDDSTTVEVTVDESSCDADSFTHTAVPVTVESLPQNQPNIVIMLIDDLGYMDISATGGEYSTPNFDEIYEGVTLSQLYGMPLCTPSRSALMTGRLPWKMGLQFMEVLHWNTVASIPNDGNTATLGEYLSGVGYQTGYYGRWALGHSNTDFIAVNRGYDHFVGFQGLLQVSGYSTTAASFMATNETGDEQEVFVMDFFDDELHVQPPIGGFNDDFIAEKITARLDSWEPSTGDGAAPPWHLFWSTQGVHKMDFYHQPPKEFAECNTTLRNLYCNHVKYRDELFGNFTKRIKARGEWDNTLIFFFSDNGGVQGFETDDELNDPGEYMSSNFPWRGGKTTYYEGGIRLLGAMGGGWLPEEYRGVTFGDRHHMSDIAATITDIAGVTDSRKNNMDGKNLFTDNHNEQLIVSISPLAEVPWVDQDSMSMGTCVYYGNYKYLKVTLQAATIWSTGTVWLNTTYAETSWFSDNDDVARCYGEDGSTGCLFDIVNDPNELENLWHTRTDLIETIDNLIWQEFFGYDYHSGQNMISDVRAATANLDSIIYGEVVEARSADLCAGGGGQCAYKTWVSPWMEGHSSLATDDSTWSYSEGFS